MKYFLIAAAVTAAIYFSGGWQKANSMFAAVSGAKAEAESRQLAQARDAMFAASYTPTAKCMQISKSSLVEVQCRNERDAAQANFNARFAEKLATGWRPKLD